MRVVLYTRQLQPLSVLDLAEHELDALAEHGPFTVSMERDPMITPAADLDKPLLLTVSIGGFNLPGGHLMRFVVLNQDDGAALLACDFLGSFPEGTTPVNRFRRVFFERLVNLLSLASGAPRRESNRDTCEFS